MTSGVYTRDLVAEIREGWAYAFQVTRQLQLGAQLRVRLCGGLTAAAVGSLLMAFGSGGTTTLERLLGALVFALGISAGVVSWTRRVLRDVDTILTQLVGIHHNTINAGRTSLMVKRLHLCAWLAPLWLVLLPIVLFALLSACERRSAATIVAVIAAVQIWLAGTGYCWLICPSCCWPIQQQHVDVPPASEVWLALASSWYNVVAMGSLVLLPIPGSLNESLLLGAAWFGWKLLLLVPVVVLALVAACLNGLLNDSMASALLSLVSLPLIRKLGGSLLHCNSTALICGSQAQTVNVGGTLMGLLVFLIALVHFCAATTTTQSLVLLDPMQLFSAVVCNTLLAFVSGAAEGHRSLQRGIAGGSTAWTTSVGDVTASAVALTAIVVAVLQLQRRCSRGLPTNLTALNTAKDGAMIAPFLTGLAVLLAPSSSVTYVANLILAGLLVVLLISTYLDQSRIWPLGLRRCHSWKQLGSKWQLLPQADDIHCVHDTDLTYHAWLQKKAQATMATDNRVCFSFWRDHDVHNADCTPETGHARENGDHADDESFGRAESSGRELDLLTISELLRCEGFRVTLLGLDAYSISAMRLIEVINKLGGKAHDKMCNFETVEFVYPDGELEPWLDDKIVDVQMAISNHAACTTNSLTARPQCKWVYAECHSRSSKPLELVDIRRSRLSPDAAERMGWAMKVNPTLRTAFLQFTTITGPLAVGISSAVNLESLALLNVEIRTDGGAAIGTLCGGVGRRCSKLQIESSKISEGGCTALAKSLRIHGSIPIGRLPLVEMRFIDCRLGRAGSNASAAIVQAVSLCRSLQTLIMVGIGMKDTDAVAFAAGISAAVQPENASSGQVSGSSDTDPSMLETLLLHNNEIGDRGAAALAEVLPTCCPNLRMLRLDNNNIGSAGVECLCHGIARAKVGGSLSIEKIFLARNPLDVNDRAEWLGCCEAMGVATDVQLMQPVIE